MPHSSPSRLSPKIVGILLKRATVGRRHIMEVNCVHKPYVALSLIGQGHRRGGGGVRPFLITELFRATRTSLIKQLQAIFFAAARLMIPPPRIRIVKLKRHESSRSQFLAGGGSLRASEPETLKKQSPKATPPAEALFFFLQFPLSFVADDRR